MPHDARASLGRNAGIQDGAVQGCATHQDSLPGQSDVDGLGSMAVSGMRGGNDIDVGELIETNRAIRQARAALRPVKKGSTTTRVPASVVMT